MADPALFDSLATTLERCTHFDKLAPRGTLRLALKAAELDPDRATPEEVVAAIFRVLPRELNERGVDDPERVCEALAICLQGTVL